MDFWSYFWLLVWWFFFVAYLMVLFQIFGDLFRDDELGGVAKALWVLVLVFFPVIAALVYLVARGKGMGRREAEQAKDREAAFRQYVRQAARDEGDPGGGGHVSDLAKLAELKDKGHLDQAEYEKAKRKLLA